MYSDPADGIIVHQTESEIARLIDHTLLKPEASREDIQRLCEEAVDYGFASVCVNPWNVSQAAELVRGSEVRVCAVVGFPLGASLSIVKAFEAGEALKSGAQEIDMVINLGALKSGQEALAEADVRGVVDACHRASALCKVILETALLTREEKIRGALLAKKAGADFVKTSTGFGPGGATAEDVRLIRETVGGGTGIKAAGGVRTLEEVRKMIEAGATRIGTSSGIKIIEELRGAKPAAAESSGASGKY
jgi:deoxyribose-phosphate aldolase